MHASGTEPRPPNLRLRLRVPLSGRGHLLRRSRVRLDTSASLTFLHSPSGLWPSRRSAARYAPPPSLFDRLVFIPYSVKKSARLTQGHCRSRDQYAPVDSISAGRLSRPRRYRDLRR